MESITLKEIAGYLAFKLELQYVDAITSIKRKAYLTNLGVNEIETTYKRKINGISGDIISWEGHNNVSEMQVKLLLHPLSMLTQEIEHNGEKFIPSEYMNENAEKYSLPADWDSVLFIEKENIKSVPYAVIEKFQEWHIDYQDLIGRGLAIDKSKI